jgi:hypothetical protein
MIYTVTGGATGYLFFTRQLTYDDSISKFCTVRELPESKRSSEVCMTLFYYEKDAGLAAIKGQTLAVVGKGYPTLHSLKALHAGEGVQATERDLMRQLGSGAKPNG